MIPFLRLVILFFLTAHLSLYFPTLADPAFLVVACGAGFLLAYLGRGFRLPLALALGVLVPWGIKFLTSAVLDLLVSWPGTAFDLVPLWVDRQTTLAILPFGLSFLSTTLVLWSPKLIPWERLTNALVLLGLFWAQGQYKVTLYPHPVYLALALGLYLFCESLILYLGHQEKRPHKPESGTPPPDVCERKKTPGRALRRTLLAAGAGILVLCTVGILWGLFRNFEEGSSQAKGGLLKHELMQFDFSKLIKLESEIALGDDLILLYREEGPAKQRYLRRFLMSGYTPDKGFFINADPTRAEENIPPVGRQKISFPPQAFTPERLDVRQEYYLVNLDPASLMTLNRPKEVQPYSKWDRSSFVGAYSAVSEVWNGQPLALGDAPGSGLSAPQLAYYTDYGNAAYIKDLAQTVTLHSEGYLGKITDVLAYLKGNYLYSLKPGSAPDGDQLKYFLTESHKGYCSYFAFSMALMLRSLGIPTRVCVGFITDPQSAMLNFYPVRSYLSHAWVEVPFEGIGWVEFDPTSENLAPGEEFSLPKTMNPEDLSKMISEILNNPAKPLNEAPAPVNKAADQWNLILQSGLSALSLYWPLVTVALLLVLLTLWNRRTWLALTLCPPGRRKVRLRWKLLQRSMEIRGLYPLPGETPRQYAHRARLFSIDLEPAAALADEARYAPELSPQRCREVLTLMKTPLPPVGPHRLLLNFFLPFLRFPSPQEKP